MLIHFHCLCPLRLAIMLNFNILKVVYLSSLSTEREKILTSGCPHMGSGKTQDSAGWTPVRLRFTCLGASSDWIKQTSLYRNFE